MKGISQKELIAIVSNLDDVVIRLDALKEDAQGYYDGRSEKWQEDEAGQLFEEALGRIEEQADALRDAASELISIGEM